MLMAAAEFVGKAGQGFGQIEGLETPLGNMLELTSSHCHEDLIAEAAGRGYLNSLRYLAILNPACCWKTRICSIAAAEGQLQVLQWARA